MDFIDSLRLAIVFGLSLFLVLLRFDSERIVRSDYFRTRAPWLGPTSYYILVIGFAIGIAFILPDGRRLLFLRGGDPGSVLPIMLLFSVVALLNAVALAMTRFGAIVPLPAQLLPARIVGAASNAVAEELQFRSVVLGLLLLPDLFFGNQLPVWIAVSIQALLFGLAQRRWWRAREWFGLSGYFLAGGVIFGYAAGLATVTTGSVIPAIVGHFAVSMSFFAFAGGQLRQRPI